MALSMICFHRERPISRGLWCKSIPTMVAMSPSMPSSTLWLTKPPTRIVLIRSCGLLRYSLGIRFVDGWWCSWLGNDVVLCCRTTSQRRRSDENSPKSRPSIAWPICFLIRDLVATFVATIIKPFPIPFMACRICELENYAFINDCPDLMFPILCLRAPWCQLKYLI